MDRELLNYTQNRELSWLRFDQRVLEEARDKSVPLLERMKFVAIFTSNLDEFFMIRVGSLYDMVQTDDRHRDSRSAKASSSMSEHAEDSFISEPVTRSAGIFWYLIWNVSTGNFPERISKLPMRHPFAV